MAVLKHIASKNADYRAAFQYLVYQHNEFTQKPILDENNRPLLREEYYMDGILCKPEGFARACKKTNAKYHKNEKKGENRQSALEKYTSIFATAAEDYAVMTAGGNSFSLPYADHITELPVESSGLAESDYSVPFMAMVLHGSVSYTSEAINMSGDPETALLKAVENGAGLYFELAYQNAPKLKETTQMNLYSSDYTIWKDSLVDYYKRANEVLGDLTDDTMVNHEYVQENVVVTTYSSGAKVAINYTDAAVTIDGVEVPAAGFCRLV
jgi:hypothetical protein